MKKQTIYFALILWLLVGCHSSDNQSEDRILNEQLLPLTLSCSEQAQENTIPLTDVQTNFVIKKMKGFEKKFFTRMAISENWLAVSQIESFSPNFDIWVIANEGEEYLKLLATIDKENNFIDIIPIACNIGNEKTKYVESEYWQADIDKEYHIVINKQYDKLYSLSEEGYESGNSLSKKLIDEYDIADNGTFVYIDKPVFDIDYKAIVMFADKEKLLSPLDENWIWNSITIQENIESLNILFKEVYQNFDKVSIYDYQGEEVDIVDISYILSQENKGYILLQKDKEPLFIADDTPQSVLDKAMTYFNMPPLQINQAQEDDKAGNYDFEIE